MFLNGLPESLSLEVEGEARELCSVLWQELQDRPHCPLKCGSHCFLRVCKGNGQNKCSERGYLTMLNACTIPLMQGPGGAPRPCHTLSMLDSSLGALDRNTRMYMAAELALGSVVAVGQVEQRENATTPTVFAVCLGKYVIFNWPATAMGSVYTFSLASCTWCKAALVQYTFPFRQGKKKTDNGPSFQLVFKNEAPL